MDWRRGSRQPPTNSTFQGTGGRGRGRGRGRGGYNGRGEQPSRPIDTRVPAVVPTPSGPPASPALLSANTSSTQPPLTSPQGSHQFTLPVPFLPQIDSRKPPAPRITRRASHDAVNTLTPLVDSEPLNTTSPSNPRSKPARKRFHSRTRSSSKVTVPGQLSTPASLTSLREKEKEKESVVSPTTGNTSTGIRTDIDTLVERVRAMAMAGSAIEKDKDKRGYQVSGEGHFDWAGDADDSLPDLDDWVQPRSTELKEDNKAEVESSSGGPTLPTVVETLSPKLQSQDVKLTEKEMHHPSQKEVVDDTIEPEMTATIRTYENSVPGKHKTRGRHTRGNKAGAHANRVLKPSTLPPNPLSHSDDVVSSSHQSLAHPLPAKPQIQAFSHNHSPKAQRLPFVAQKAISTVPTTAPFVSLPQGSQASPHGQISQEIDSSTTGKVSDSSPRPKASHPAIDSTSAPSLPPLLSDAPCVDEAINNSSQSPSHLSGSVPGTQPRKRGFDPSIDWASAPPRNKHHSRSRSRHSHSSDISRPSVKSESASEQRGKLNLPHTCPPPPPSLAKEPFLSLPQPSPSPAISLVQKTRSQRNSPERTQGVGHEGTSTHFRAHSSPQPGQILRTSRPVITLDGISIISRTLGVAVAGAPPPRGQFVGVSTVEVSAAD